MLWAIPNRLKFRLHAPSRPATLPFGALARSVLCSTLVHFVLHRYEVRYHHCRSELHPIGSKPLRTAARAWHRAPGSSGIDGPYASIGCVLSRATIGRPPSVTCFTAKSRNSAVYLRSGPAFIRPPQGQKQQTSWRPFSGDQFSPAWPPGNRRSLHRRRPERRRIAACGAGSRFACRQGRRSPARRTGRLAPPPRPSATRT
jgi:hypothetical protein